MSQKSPVLSLEQQKAMELLRSGENVFLTGGAGSGKSFLIKQFIKEVDTKSMPILASTGAAAVLIGGRTFHSFFGLGIMEGGPQACFERAKSDSRLMRRIAKAEGVIIDEISMISSTALEVAEAIAKEARGSVAPWGGLRIITVGDFAQLPPVTKTNNREWSFLSPVWQSSGFSTCLLSHNQRVNDDAFLDVLNDVRTGKISSQVVEFLNSRVREHDESEDGTRLFPRRDQSEYYNNKKLSEIQKPEEVIHSIYFGDNRFVEILKKNSPLPEKLVLKVGARVMFIQNDPQWRWVNGTRGNVTEIMPDKIIVEKDRGREVTVEKTMFGLQDAEGNVVASVMNFPLVLAYATTIHKSQGATLENLWVDLTRLWEPGQAYVALSRLQSGKGLNLLRWNPRSVIVDSRVLEFYNNLSVI